MNKTIQRKSKFINIEYIDFKDSLGRNYRVLIDRSNDYVRIVMDHEVLKHQQQTETFTPYIPVTGFGYE